MLREENIASVIYMVRGEKVMLDMDLAALYGVQTNRLKEAVRRNIDRFPDDFVCVCHYLRTGRPEQLLGAGQRYSFKGGHYL